MDPHDGRLQPQSLELDKDQSSSPYNIISYTIPSTWTIHKQL